MLTRTTKLERRNLIAILLLVLAACSSMLAQQAGPLVNSMDAVSMTVADMDRSVAFYSSVLSFKKISDLELDGETYEHLEGIFGLHLRVVRMKLGDESLELVEYVAPRGRPIPVDSRSNDRSQPFRALLCDPCVFA